MPSYQRLVPSEIQLMSSIKAKEKAGVWESGLTSARSGQRRESSREGANVDAVSRH